MGRSRITAPSAYFSITLPVGTPVTEVLDIWQPEAPEAAAFALGPAAAPPSDVTWRADFPAGPILAQRALADSRAEIAAVAAALEQVDRRLDAFMAAQPLSNLGSFAAGPQASAWTPALTPEQTLAELLRATTQPASFALGDPWREQAAAEAQSAQGFLDQVRQLLDAYAWVETSIEGQVIARTRVSWTGDFDTVWAAGSQAGQQHAETVALALASRTMWVRFAGHMLTGALRLGKWLAVPGGAALALPGLWRFINDMADEYRSIQQATHA